MDRDQLAQELPDQADRLLRFTRTLTHDPQQAQDLAQETMTRALERSESFRGDAGLSTWLHRIAHNLAVDQSRRKQEVPSDELAESVEALWRNESYTVDAQTVVSRAQQRRELEMALHRLPVIYRTAVVLHDAEGMTMKQIADIQNIGLPAAKQRLRRGRMMLVSELSGEAALPMEQPVQVLDCWQARSRVSDYMNDSLAKAERASVEAHLETCPTCPPLYHALVGVRAALRGDPKTEGEGV
ncbi:MAG: sigma-70 family RNA polymerase sigma factor [Candidatus Nanopelagicales bacterium]